MKVLRSRLYEMERERQEAGTAMERRSQVGGAWRSEKIRTYQFLQGRVTDHRVGLTLYKLDSVLDGGLDATILCTGGDTLLALMGAVDVAELIPVCELDAGAVLTDFVYKGKTHHIISKSGGFGEPDLFYRLALSVGAGDQEEDVIC